jgi:hypothetical protein
MQTVRHLMTTSQTKQFTLDEALAAAARDQGMDLVQRFAFDDLKRAIVAAIVEAARRHETFTTDAVLPLIDRPVQELRLLGPLMTAARNLGLIEPTPWFENSASVSRHGAPKRIWKSHIFGGNP